MAMAAKPESAQNCSSSVWEPKISIALTAAYTTNTTKYRSATKSTERNWLNSSLISPTCAALKEG